MQIKAGLIAGATLAASLFASAASSAEFGLDKRFYIAPQINYNYFDNDGNFEDKEGFSLSVGKPILSWLDLELQGFFVDAETNAGVDADYEGYGLALRFFPGRYTMPFYALAGYSIGDDSINGNSEDAEFFEAGVGYVSALTDHGSSIRVEYRARRTEADGLNIHPVNHLVSLGLEIPFGAAKPLNETVTGQPNYHNTKVAHRPATADWTSNGPCVDADFDGVCDFGDQCPNTPVGVVANGLGCTPTQPVAPFADDTPMILEGVEFEFDSAQLTTTSLPILDRAAETLRAHPGIPVEVGGHTDSKGSITYNLNLSLLRAQTVYNYLVKKGVASQRLSYQGYGESMPIADNSLANGEDNPEGRARNRRVELRAKQ